MTDKFAEWRSGGVEEWRSGGVEEWRTGGAEDIIAQSRSDGGY
jgi:hypothetical protein